MDNCPVKKILADSIGQSRLILSDDRTVVTKYLVICAGPWTNRLLDPIGTVFEHYSSFRFSKTRQNGQFLALLINFCPLKR